MKLEVGKKYRTREGEIVTVERKVASVPHSYKGSNQCFYTERGLWLYTEHSPCDLVEEIQENTMFNKEYKYLSMDADGFNKAFIGKPEIFEDVWLSDDDDLLLQKNVFNLGDDWKESLREIVYTDDGSIYLRKPRHEFKVDDKVLVRGTGDSDWKKRHFSHWDCNGKPRCFADGTTSFSGVHVNMWDEIKPYVEEE